MVRTVAFGKCSVLLLVLLAVTVGAQRTYDRCSLARQMYQLDVPRNELAIWACIAEHESSYRTWVKGPPNDDGSIDHGIFQINDLYWCKPSDGRFSHNYCDVNCDALRTDHIDSAVRCARKVLRNSHNGWQAWSVYNRYCNGHLPSIEDCFGSGSSNLFGASMSGKF